MNRSATNDVADLARVEKDGQRAGDDREKILRPSHSADPQSVSRSSVGERFDTGDTDPEMLGAGRRVYRANAGRRIGRGRRFCGPTSRLGRPASQAAADVAATDRAQPGRRGRWWRGGVGLARCARPQSFRRFPDRPRDRPRRHGDRLRGRAGPAGPPVALKVLPLAAALDPRALQRFQLEAQVAGLLAASRGSCRCTPSGWSTTSPTTRCNISKGAAWPT